MELLKVRGQEFVIEENEKVEVWAKKIIVLSKTIYTKTKNEMAENDSTNLQNTYQQKNPMKRSTRERHKLKRIHHRGMSVEEAAELVGVTGYAWFRRFQRKV